MLGVISLGCVMIVVCAVPIRRRRKKMRQASDFVRRPITNLYFSRQSESSSREVRYERGGDLVRDDFLLARAMEASDTVSSLSDPEAISSSIGA